MLLIAAGIAFGTVGVGFRRRQKLRSFEFALESLLEALSPGIARRRVVTGTLVSVVVVPDRLAPRRRSRRITSGIGILKINSI